MEQSDKLQINQAADSFFYRSLDFIESQTYLVKSFLGLRKTESHIAPFSRIIQQATNSMLSRDSAFSFLLQANEGKSLMSDDFVNHGCI